MEEIESKTPVSLHPADARAQGSDGPAGCVPVFRRPIRSYVLRQGRMTEAQRRAFDELWPRYGVTLDRARLDLGAIFDRDAAVILEIGFGNGDALLAAARAFPEINFFGAEVHRPGVGSLLLKLAQAGVENVRVVNADVNDVLARLDAGALDGIHLFFPDPWPKKRHRKRRLMQPAFAARLRDILKSGGYVHCATDWEDYAAQMREVLEATSDLTNAAGAGRYAERPASRPLTRFEQRGRAAGRLVRDLFFRRC